MYRCVCFIYPWQEWGGGGGDIFSYFHCTPISHKQTSGKEFITHVCQKWVPFLERLEELYTDERRQLVENYLVNLSHVRKFLCCVFGNMYEYGHTLQGINALIFLVRDKCVYFLRLTCLSLGPNVFVSGDKCFRGQRQACSSPGGKHVCSKKEWLDSSTYIIMYVCPFPSCAHNSCACV